MVRNLASTPSHEGGWKPAKRSNQTIRQWVAIRHLLFVLISDALPACPACDLQSDLHTSGRGLKPHLLADGLQTLTHARGFGSACRVCLGPMAGRLRVSKAEAKSGPRKKERGTKDDKEGKEEAGADSGSEREKGSAIPSSRTKGPTECWMPPQKAGKTCGTHVKLGQEFGGLWPLGCEILMHGLNPC